MLRSQKVMLHLKIHMKLPRKAELASVSQLDACLTGDQEVAGSNPAMSAYHGDLIMKYFPWPFSPFS